MRQINVYPGYALSLDLASLDLEASNLQIFFTFLKNNYYLVGDQSSVLFRLLIASRCHLL